VTADEDLSSTRPEAWAMNYVAASTLMTSFGATPVLAPGQWRLGLDLGHVPRLDDDQQTVGFIGSKREDLNKSPVFGRIRAAVGLPGGFVADVGYTPPVMIEGARPRELFAVAFGKRVYERDAFNVSMRAFGQHGRGHADITCPAHLARAPLEENPYGCQEASNDRIVLNYYGIDATAAWNARPWHAYATAGYTRTDLEVQVDALTFEVRDRSRLTARGSWPFLAIGASRDVDKHWNVALEFLYVPLSVQRTLDGSKENDPFAGLRVQATYRFD
jgi:hypothetical protein